MTTHMSNNNYTMLVQQLNGGIFSLTTESHTFRFLTLITTQYSSLLMAQIILFVVKKFPIGLRKNGQRTLSVNGSFKKPGTGLILMAVRCLGYLKKLEIARLH